MLNEFDQYLHERYLSGKARKDRWYWNNSIQRGRSTAVRENWQWKPAVAYCRYADDFVLIVKGTKAQAEAIREECRGVLEGSLKLRLNMDKTKITHVNDGFIFLGHRIIRKRSRYGEMRVVSTIPQEKARNFAASLTALLSGNYSESKVDMAEQLNRKLKGWAMFYQFVDFKAKVFSYIDRVVFWKLAHWLARKYRTGGVNHRNRVRAKRGFYLVKPITASSAAKYCTGWWGKARSCSAGGYPKVIPI